MTISPPSALILSGYGLNSEEETLFGFVHSGATGEIVHINDLIESPDRLNDFQILAIPGGFSFGDDTGSGNAYANRLRNHLWEALLEFIERDTLTIGICNGAQILANLGLIPALDNQYGERQIAMQHNASNRYECRWVDVKAYLDNASPWLTGIHTMHIPVSHGEGNYTMTEEVLAALKQNHQIALTYVGPDGTMAAGEFPTNPNGAVADIAALTDPSGRILQIMPHPERGMLMTQRDDWTMIKEHYKRAGEALPEEADGMRVFRNAVRYFG